MLVLEISLVFFLFAKSSPFQADINTKTEEFVSNKKILDDLAAKPNKRKKERLVG